MTGQLSLIADQLPIDGSIRRWARFSPDRRYRWELGRAWTTGPMLKIIGLNPSTADENENDQTIRRGMHFSRREQLAGLLMLNVCCFCSTDPAGLDTAVDPIGAEADDVLLATALTGGKIVVAWGDPIFATKARRSRRGPRVDHVLRLLSANADLYCFGRTASGNPRHPSRLPNATGIEMFVKRGGFL